MSKGYHLKNTKSRDVIMRYQQIEITNMIMIEDPDTQEVLVENRINPKWPGLTFPGGHVELRETLVESVIREAYEETGLIVSNLKFCGIKEWPLPDNARYLVFLFKTQTFSGEIKASKEGQLQWLTREVLLSKKLANTFKEMLPVFDDDNIAELALKKDQADEPWKIYWQ